MSQFPPPPAPLPYATPLPRYSPRPTSVTVLAVLAIIFGSLSVLGMLCSLPQYMGLRITPNPVLDAIQKDPVLLAYHVGSLVIGLALGISLLWAGIGALSLKPTARRLMIGYAVCYIVVATLGVIVNLAFIYPRTEQIMQQAGSGNSQQMQTIMQYGYYGGMCLGLVVLIWPVLILYFMNRPHVKAAFGVTLASPVVLPPPGPFTTG